MGDREENLRTAIAKLAALGELVTVSSFYETEPMEFGDQPWFLNCAVAMKTALMPQQFLVRMQKIEQEMGRRRIRPKGPRTKRGRRSPAVVQALPSYNDRAWNTASRWR